MASNDFAAQVRADGPVGYWRLAEPRGSTTAADDSGNGNVGTCSTSGITFGLPGLYGGDTAALFDGATGRISVNNSESTNPARITMEAKVRWDGPTGLQQRILEKESYTGITQYGLSVLQDGRVHVELRMRESTLRVVSADSRGVVALGSETHVVATYDGLAIAIYLNGAPNGLPDSTTIVNTTPVDIDTKVANPPTDLEVALAIGDRMSITGGQHRTFNGLIDEVALYARPLSAQRIEAHYRAQFAFEYAVKVVCGRSTGEVVAPGAYFTAVNIHNPGRKATAFRVKFAGALPGLKPGPVSGFHDAKLGPDEALEVDCPDIRNIARARDPFLKGFLVIESPTELDVVAVYTAAGREGDVEALHMERVPPRAVAAG